MVDTDSLIMTITVIYPFVTQTMVIIAPDICAVVSRLLDIWHFMYVIVH